MCFISAGAKVVCIEEVEQFGVISGVLAGRIPREAVVFNAEGSKWAEGVRNDGKDLGLGDRHRLGLGHVHRGDRSGCLVVDCIPMGYTV